MTRSGLEADFTVRRSESFRLSVSLGVPGGRTVALVGPNGAGKSTVVAALAGLLAVDTGRITLGETTLDDADGAPLPPEERRVGVVFQDALLFPHLSALENVAFGLRSRGVPRTDARRRAGEWLARLGVERLAEQRPDRLSGGQAQRVALARALAPDPALLLLDEPLSALDVAGRATLRRVLAEHLAGFDGPRLLVTHDPAEAFLLADEVVVLEDGRVTQRGSVEEIRLRPRTAYAAELAGINLVRGTARDGAVDTGAHILKVADDRARGPVRLAIRPNAVSVHLARPDGSPRNTWSTEVVRVESVDARVRVLTGPPLPLVVEVTRAARDELGLAPGREVWLAVKATEIGVEAEDDPRSEGNV